MLLKLFALIIPLGLDTFAVAASLGIAGLSRRDRWRVAALFMAFEGGMPLVGLGAGIAISAALGQIADWSAIVLLFALGGYMLLADRDGDSSAGALLARTRGPAIVGLGISISLDELAIGFALGLFRAPIVLAVGWIAVQAFAVAQLGFWLGSKVGESLRERAERAAAAVLLLLAAALAVGQLSGGRV